MKPFHFPLNSLRVLRQHKEQTAQERYALALRACESAAAKVQAASVELTACWKNLCEEMGKGVNSTDLLRIRAWCNVLELRLKERASELETARFAVDAVWKELMQATREREVLDRYYEKRRLLHEREEQRRDQKELDELAINLSVSGDKFRLSDRATSASL
jgi:flagellar export protein FliJ